MGLNFVAAEERAGGPAPSHPPLAGEATVQLASLDIALSADPCL